MHHSRKRLDVARGHMTLFGGGGRDEIDLQRTGSHYAVIGVAEGVNPQFLARGHVERLATSADRRAGIGRFAPGFKVVEHDSLGKHAVENKRLAVGHTHLGNAIHTVGIKLAADAVVGGSEEGHVFAIAGGALEKRDEVGSTGHNAQRVPVVGVGGEIIPHRCGVIAISRARVFDVILGATGRKEESNGCEEDIK